MLLTSPEYLATGMHQYAVKKYSDTFPVIKYLNIYHFVFPSIVPTAHGEVYSIQHYVMKFVRLAQVGVFLRLHLFPPPIKLTATI